MSAVMLISSNQLPDPRRPAGRFGVRASAIPFEGSPAMTIPQRGRMAELARYFLRLGFRGFGGPVAVGGEVMP